MLTKRILKFFSSKSVPIIDVEKFLTQSEGYENQCKQVASALHQYGCLIIKDPRVNQKDNDTFLNMMERYFHNRGQLYYKGQSVDIFPQTYYQVGATPQFKQLAKSHQKVISQFTEANKAQTPQPPSYDAKWRYFWRIGQLDEHEKNQKPHIPKDFPQFKNNMNKWGNHMLNGCLTVAQMAAIGLGLKRKIFVEKMKKGPHLLAPTGSDLVKYNPNTIFAGFHYDFNFLTIHGKSRFPGLFVWLRTGQKINVSVPEGHLLLQAGKQFQILTGGYVTCGFHQVVYTSQVQKAKDKAIKEGRIPWRVSSTLFSHIREDVILQPLEKFNTEQSRKKYKSILTKDFVIEQLKQIKLAS